jgi:hypothetical protein
LKSKYKIAGKAGSERKSSQLKAGVPDPSCLSASLAFNRYYGDSILLNNVGEFLPDYTALEP